MTAIVLVTDLVDSTAQRCELGEELADEHGRYHDLLIADVVAGGHGWLVKGTGDGALIAFDSASAAIVTALELRDAFKRYSNSAEAIAPLHARFGLSAGDVTWSEVAGRLDCSGLAVIEATRLQANAAPDEIICSELVRLLACGRGFADYEPLAPINLAGIPNPVPANRVFRSHRSKRGVGGHPLLTPPRATVGPVARPPLLDESAL